MEVLLIEENKLFREALKKLIIGYPNVNLIHDFGSLEEIPKKRKQEIDLAILSIYTPEEDLRDAILTLEQLYPKTEIIILSELLTKKIHRILARYNIYAFLSTRSGSIELESFVTNFNKYEVYSEIKLDALSKNDLRNEKKNTSVDVIAFTKRELEVLNLVSLEYSNAEISAALGLSVRTIETFRRRMIKKTDCRNMIGVVLKAIQCKYLRINNSL